MAQKVDEATLEALLSGCKTPQDVAGVCQSNCVTAIEVIH